jgi:hypothetical protein
MATFELFPSAPLREAGTTIDEDHAERDAMRRRSAERSITGVLQW